MEAAIHRVVQNTLPIAQAEKPEKELNQPPDVKMLFFRICFRQGNAPPADLARSRKPGKSMADNCLS